MSRSWIAPLLALMLLILPSAARGSIVEAPNRPPNILFLFADDYSFEAVGALGLLDVVTPNIDRLYQRGTSFSRTYNMGGWNGAICVASRAMLISGRTLWDAHAIDPIMVQERMEGRFWPILMKEGGYVTSFTGKWHIRAQAELAFDEARHVRPGMPNQTETGYNRPLADGSDPWDPSDPHFGGFWDGGSHWSEVTANDAIAFLDHAKDQESPFFMYVAFNAPHDPRQSPQEFVDRYPMSRVTLPENFLAEYPYKDAIGCPPTLRDEALAPFPRTEHAVKIHRGEYFAIIEHLDEQIGRIFDALESSGKVDETVVIFTADHGLAVGRHGFMGKQNLYEHSTRVPFVMAGPGIEQGKQIDSPIYLQDVMPTTLELAGLPIPDFVGFQSLMPMLEGNREATGHKAIYGAYINFQRSVTKDDFALILYPDVPVVRLYHLAADPHQLRDLSSDPDQADRLDDLYQCLRRLQKELNDPLDLTEIFGLTLTPAQE